MSMNETNLIFHDWIKKKENWNIKLKFGSYTEKILKINSLGQKSFNVIGVYMFLYELFKIYDLMHILIYSKENDLETSIIYKLLKFITSEKYFEINSSYDFLSILFLLLWQFVIAIYIILDFIFISEMEFQISQIRKIFFNLINFSILVSAYSFNYINLRVIIEINVYTNSDYLIYYFNIINLNLFNIVYLIYIYLYNDVSPTENKLYISVSNPSFRIIKYFKFLLFNVSTLFSYILPSYVLFFLNISYLVYYLYFIHKNIYVINQTFYRFLIIKCLFFKTLLMSHYFYSFIKFEQKIDLINELLLLIFSFLTGILLLPYFEKKRKELIYCPNDYKNNGVRMPEDELFIYHLYSKKIFTSFDRIKYENISQFYSNEYIHKTSSFSINLGNQEEIDEMKVKSCSILSLIMKKTSIFNLIQLNYLLEGNDYNHNIFIALLKLESSQLKIYHYHFFIRIIRKLNIKHDNFHKNPNSSNINKSRISLFNINTIIKYENTFRSFLKNVKKTIKKAFQFWENIKIRPINIKIFLKEGDNIAKLSIEISEQFRKMQELNLNQIKLLKTYSCFLNNVLNDYEFSSVLFNIIRDKLSLHDIGKTMYSNLLDKDFGVFIISGEPNSLHKILSFNKYFKSFFQFKEFNIKNQNLNYLLPFPFNILHSHYLNKKLNFTLLSKERRLFLLNENGDMVYAISYINPCFNFFGRINFFMIFYEIMDKNLDISALVDMQGLIFSASKNFKEEFKINSHINIKDNVQLFESYFRIVNDKNCNEFYNISRIFNEFYAEKIFNYPNIFDYIDDCKFFFSKNNFFPINNKKANDIDFPKMNNLITTTKNSEINNFLSNYKKKVNDNLEIQFKNNVFDKIDKLRPLKTSLSIIDEFEKNMKPNLTNNNGISCKLLESIILSSNNISGNIGIIENDNNFFINKKGYDIKIKKKNSLSQMFHYYHIKIRKVRENGDNTQDMVNLKCKTPQYSNRKEFKLENIEASSILSIYPSANSYHKNKFTIGNFVNPFKSKSEKTTPINSITKTIYIYLTIIFLGILLFNVLNIIFSYKELNEYRQISNIMNYILLIRLRFNYLIMNTRSLLHTKMNFTSENNKFYKNKSKYLNSSIMDDMNKINYYVTKVSQMPLQSYKSTFNMLISTQSNLTILMDNYNTSFQNYSFYTVINVFLSEINSLVQPNNLQKYYNDYLKTCTNNNTTLTYYDKINNFIFDNYKYSLIISLDHSTKAVYVDLTDIIFYFNRIKSVILILEGIMFCLALILIFKIVLYLYSIHYCMVKLYSKLGNSQINIFLFYLNETFKIILNLKNDEKYLSLINKNMKQKLKESKYKNLNKICEFNQQSFEDSQIERLETKLNNNKIINTNTSFIRKIDDYKTLKSYSESSFPDIDLTNSRKTFILKRLGSFYKYNSFYLNYFMRGFLIIVSLNYLIIIDIYLRPNLIKSINDIHYSKSFITVKADSEFILWDFLRSSILKNSSNLNLPVENERFSSYIKLFINNQIEYIKMIFNQKDVLFMNLPSNYFELFNSDFCYFFFNNVDSINVLNPGQIKNDCQTIMKYGILVYYMKFDNEVKNLFYEYTNQDKWSIEFSVNLTNSDNIMSKEVAQGYYLRGFYFKLLEFLEDSFNNHTQFYIYVSTSLFVLLLFHLCGILYLALTKYFEKIYMCFEKSRILISIIQNITLIKRNEIKEFLLKYY